MEIKAKRHEEQQRELEEEDENSVRENLIKYLPLFGQLDNLHVYGDSVLIKSTACFSECVL